jgi:hypothetical protein
VRRHRGVEVGLVLDDAREDERHPHLGRDLDGLRCPLVRMDSAEEEQVGPGGRMEIEGAGVDAVVDGGQVVEAGVAVGIADGDVGAPPLVLHVHREDPRRREPMDRGEHGRRDEPAVAEGQEVEAVVDEIELAGALEGRGDVQAFRHLGVEARVLRPPAGNHRGQPGRREGVAGGEEGDVDGPRHEASVSRDTNRSHGP